MIPFIPHKILGIFDAYGVIPMTNIGIGQFYNICFFLFCIIFFYINRKNSKTYAKGIVKKHSVLMLDGKTGSGKTRILTQISKDSREQNPDIIIISNFINGYGDFYFSSLQDFKLLQIDIARLGEFLNFSEEEKNQIESQFPGYFSYFADKNFLKKIKKIKGKYDILTLGDEFYGYFHTRNFMGNFSQKSGGDELLLNLHQTRHSNQTIILSAQDSEEIDLDFRQIAHNEINVFSLFFDIFFGYNRFRYLNKKEIKEYGIEYKRVNFFPHLFINYYEISLIINEFLNFLNKIRNLFLKKNYKKIYHPKKFFIKKHLKFFSKFNVKKTVNIYNPGDIYDYILEKEKKVLTKK